MQDALFLIIFLIFLTSLCDTANQLLLKSAINQFKVTSPVTLKKIFLFILALIRMRRVWGSFFFSSLSLCIWLIVLSKADLNFAFSVDSMHYILIALASHSLLKEQVGPKRWLGTSLIVCGIILVSLS
jgi:uncharacterized membrane protein